MRYLALLGSFLLISSAASAENDWFRLDITESPIQIVGEQFESKRDCEFKVHKNEYLKTWRCTEENPRYSFVIYFEKYSAGGFEELLNLTDIIQKMFDGKIYSAPDSQVFYHSGYDLIRVSGDARTGYVFKQQDHLVYDKLHEMDHGNQEAMGRWLVYGIYLANNVIGNDPIFAKQFVHRINIEGIIKGKSPRVNSKPNTPQKNSAKTFMRGKPESIQTLEDKLLELKKLYEKGLIPEQLYIKKVEAILE